MSRHPQVYCGNTALATQLQENGGDEIFGRPSPYAPHIEQRLYFGDKIDIPAAYVARATLPQAVCRGYAVGSRARAELERKQRKTGETPLSKRVSKRRRSSPGFH